jgi:hypothetical protein
LAVTQTKSACAKQQNVRVQPIPAPSKSRQLSSGLEIPVENIEMGTHFLPKKGRTHNERKKTFEILGLCENSRSTIIGRLDMEFMQSSNGKHGRALPRKQALSVLLWR